MAKEFVWTDALVKQLAHAATGNIIDFVSDSDAFIKDFKKSKQNSNKDWEIVLWVDVKGVERSADIYTDNMFSNCKSQATIKSVRRLSDGEVFSVGDKVKLIRAKEIGEITKFSKSEISNKLFVYINLGGGEGYNNEIKYAEKVKKPLFTTEDGVDIYEGGECWCVENGRYSYRWSDIVDDGTIGECKYFSTEEAAEDYIFRNKPCLSYKDVMNCYYQYLNQFHTGNFQEALKGIVQQKLK